MNYFKVQQHRNAPACIEVTDITNGKCPTEAGWVSRHDFKTLEQAQEIADQASVFKGVDYIATDAGSSTYPRFDVIEAPRVLDPVSYSFNGDSHPCGHIKTISKTLKKITTTSGYTFYRYKQSGSWKMKCWYMVSGHHEERNPHF